MGWPYFVTLALLYVTACIATASEPGGFPRDSVAAVQGASPGPLVHSFQSQSPATSGEKPRRKDGMWGASKPHAIVDCTRNDLEEIRQLLLATPEYPVKYGPSTMRSFARSERFFDMCVVAKEVKTKNRTGAGTDADSEAETEAETDREEDTRVLGRVVGVVGAAEMSVGSANILMVAVDKNFRRMGLGKKSWCNYRYWYPCMRMYICSYTYICIQRVSMSMHIQIRVICRRPLLHVFLLSENNDEGRVGKG